MDVSALLRFIAEAPWFPTALVPGEHVRWEPVDSDSALVVVRDRSITVSGVFRFDGAGRIVEFETRDRFQGTGDSAVRRPWGGVYRAYEEVDGFRIPAAAEARWLQPPDVFAYARFELEHVEYDVLEPF